MIYLKYGVLAATKEIYIAQISQNPFLYLLGQFPEICCIQFAPRMGFYLCENDRTQINVWWQHQQFPPKRSPPNVMTGIQLKLIN